VINKAGNLQILVVDRTIVYQFGLLLTFGLALSDCSYALLQNPDHLYDAETHQNLKKSLVDKILNHILHWSLVVTTV
jgi:hypothetical protein